MIIQKLKLFNFRNYNKLEIKPSKNINIFYGNNAQGKTNILESIFYLSTTKSHRCNNEMDLIKDGEDISSINCELIKNNINLKLGVNLSKEGKKLFANADNIKKVSEYIGILNAVVFSPNEINLFNDTPKDRRKFIDLEIMKLDRNYTKLLNAYNKTLKNRNKVLKSNDIDLDLLEVYTVQLIDYCYEINNIRNIYINNINIVLRDNYKLITNEDVNLEIKYNSFIGNNVSKDKIKELFISNLEKDKILRQTYIGIHKDDYKFYLNNKLVENYCSQGQRRSVILAIKLAMIDIIKNNINELPILLLDDVFSELDHNHRLNLMNNLDSDMQIFITTNDLEKDIINKNMKIFKIENGIIEEESYGS